MIRPAFDRRRRMRSLSAACLLSGILLTGCFNFGFEHIQAVDDASFEHHVIRARRPVLLFPHGGLSARGTHSWGQPLERFAAFLDGRVTFLHYDVNAEGEWFRKLNLRLVGAPTLFVDGRRSSQISMFMPAPEGRAAQLFEMLRQEVMPRTRFGGHAAPSNLNPAEFEPRVLRASRPVVLAFDRLHPG